MSWCKAMLSMLFLPAWLHAQPAPAPPRQAVARAAPGIPFKREGSGDGGRASLGAVAGLLVVLAGSGAGVVYLRKQLRLGGKAGQAGLVRVLESRRLGPKTLLSVVEFGGQRLLLAQSDSGVQCVASVPVPAAKDAA
jgi:hypothetical protein